MARVISGSATGMDASYFGPQRTEQLEVIKECTWQRCRDGRHEDLPVCLRHALVIGGRVKDLLWTVLQEPKPNPNEVWIPREYVYYLMVAPETVKIGTTTCLPKRVKSLRSELQYVVAIERGGMRLEKQRHAEFAADRVSRREDFRISDGLKAHIEQLIPHREDVITEATTAPFGKMVAKPRENNSEAASMVAAQLSRI